MTEQLTETDIVNLSQILRWLQSQEKARCTRCNREVYINSFDDLPRHFADDGMTNRGCRAGSFNSGLGWDDAIPGSWIASINPNVKTKLGDNHEPRWSFK